MSILTAISRGCKGTLVDGSVRYTIEFTPLDAVAAAKLFAMPGTEMGVVALKDGRDHTEDVLDMVPRALNVVFGDETTAVRTNGAALPMANEECGAGGFISALADQFVDANKTIVDTPMEIAQRGLVKLAGILSNDRKFWEYVGTMHPVTPTTTWEAANYIRQDCGITSRSELAHDARAAIYFRGMMRSFDEWSKK